MKKHITALCGALAVAGLSVAAQAPQPPRAQQPTTTRPQAPADAPGTRAGDTLTVIGCVTTSQVSQSSGGQASDASGQEQSGGPKVDATSKYMLTSVHHPAGTQGTGQQQGVHHMSYALTTEGSTIDLSKHLNHKVELTGTLAPTTGRSPQVASTGTSGSTGTATVGRDANAMEMPAATLRVASLKMISATCP